MEPNGGRRSRRGGFRPRPLSHWAILALMNSMGPDRGPVPSAPWCIMNPGGPAAPLRFIQGMLALIMDLYVFQMRVDRDGRGNLRRLRFDGNGMPPNRRFGWFGRKDGGDGC